MTDKISKDKLKEPILRLEENHITVKMYGPEDPLVDAGPRKPRVYVSIGDEWKPFTTLRSLPIQEKKRWLHFHSPDELESYKLFYCWLRGTDPLPENKTVPPTRFSSDTPLISVFTSSYRSKEKFNVLIDRY